jgi:translocation and assembly module TamB
VLPFLSDSVLALAIGENSFQGTLASQPGGPIRVETDVNLESLVYNDLRLSSFDGSVSATTEVQGGLLAVLDDLSVEALRNAQVRGEAGYLATGSFATREAAFDAIYDGDEIDLEARVRVDEQRDVRVAGVLDPRPDAQRLRLDTLNVRFGPDRWKLLQDATISYGEEYRVSNLLLYTEDGQQIAVDGVVDFDGRQSLIVTLEAFRIGAVADLLGYPNLNGTAGGALTLSGPADSPELSGALSLDLEASEERERDLELALDYAGQRLAIDAALLNEDESSLTVEGYLPLDLRLTRPDALAGNTLADSLAGAPADTVAIGEEGSPVDIVEVRADTLDPGQVALAVRADSFAVKWIRPFLDAEQVQNLGGRLSADIDVGGTLAAPRVEGSAFLTDGTLELAALGTTYENIQADVALTGDQVTLRKATLESGDGRLTADGTVNLQALTLGELAIDIDASEFRVVDTDDYRATASAELQLTGTTESPDLRGDVTVRDADLYLDAFRGGGAYEDVELTEEDVRELRENFGVRITAADTTQSQVYQALAMNLDVEIERDTWLRSTSNPELDVQLEGNLDLEKAAQEDLQLFGSIEVVPERSRVVQFGRRFDIASGVVTFNGDPVNPSIDFEAEYNVASRRSRGNEATITLSVRGQPDDLNFELGSDPSMETSDILSYIAIGQPAGAARQGGSGGGTESLATGAALGQLTGFVEGIAGDQGLGLDIIEFEQDPQRGTVLVAGEYFYLDVLPNPLFVAVSQPLNGVGTSGTGDDENETEVTLEYEVTDGLLVRLLRRESIRLNLRFEYAY